jgi:hypothetical protein
VLLITSMPNYCPITTPLEIGFLPYSRM